MRQRESLIVDDHVRTREYRSRLIQDERSGAIGKHGVLPALDSGTVQAEVFGIPHDVHRGAVLLEGDHLAVGVERHDEPSEVHPVVKELPLGTIIDEPSRDLVLGLKDAARALAHAVNEGVPAVELVLCLGRTPEFWSLLGDTLGQARDLLGD